MSQQSEMMDNATWLQSTVFSSLQSQKLDGLEHTTQTTAELASLSVDDYYDAELTDELQDMISIMLNGYLTAFCVIIGILLNIICIFVFIGYRHRNRPVIQYYLVTLTAWQTALLCNAFLLYCLPTLIYGHLVSTGSYVYLYPYAYALANTTHTGSVWVVLTLTIDRYLALCRPLTHRAIGKRSRVKRLMIAVSLLAVLYSLPRFFEVQAKCIVYSSNSIDSDQAPQLCVPTVTRTELTQNRTYWRIYHIILAMLFVTLIPCLLLFAMTVRISIAIRRAYVRRKILTSELHANEIRSNSKRILMGKQAASSRMEHRSNVMLILVIAKFLISDILPTVADALEHFVGNEVFVSSALATIFVDVSNFLLVLNCSTNFWVFIIWGRHFRHSFFSLVRATTVGASICRHIKCEMLPLIGAVIAFKTIDRQMPLLGAVSVIVVHAMLIYWAVLLGSGNHNTINYWASSRIDETVLQIFENTTNDVMTTSTSSIEQLSSSTV